jgi:hypothetical protein
MTVTVVAIAVAYPYHYVTAQKYAADKTNKQEL